MIRTEKDFLAKLRQTYLKDWKLIKINPQYGTKGFPDVIAVDTKNQKVYFFELKINDRPSPLQKHWLNMLPNSFCLNLANDGTSLVQIILYKDWVERIWEVPLGELEEKIRSISQEALL